MLDILFIKIVICSACFGWIWVNKLTANYGLFDWLPAYYPSLLNEVLQCSFCTAGWTSIIAVLCLFDLSLFNTYLYLINAPFCTMIMVGVLDKVQHISYK